MKKAIFFCLFLACCLALPAQTVRNVKVEQVGKKIVINYDLDKRADIAVCYSTDGGKTYSSPVKKLTGDVGQGIKAGHKTATWDVLAEVEKLVCPNLVIRVIPGGGKLTYTVNGVSFKMVYVAGGTFTMGATAEQRSDYCGDEKPTHNVTLSSYYIGETEVTQALWQAVMGNNPSYTKTGGNYPVENVSWDDCQTFISKLNNLLSGQLDGKRFALPTEAQWEYAARGGSNSKGDIYSGSNTLGDVAWYTDNCGSKTHPVALKQPNELGLYDMSGNVWEWCQDWYGNYSSNSQTNPAGPSSGSYRVDRGGGWCFNAGFCRVSYRSYFAPSNRRNYLGLRLCLLP